MRRWLFYILAVTSGWIAFFGLVSALPVLSSVFTWRQSILVTLNQWLPWAFLSPLIFWLARRFPIGWTAWRSRLSLHLLAGFLCVVTSASLSHYFIAPTRPPFRPEAGRRADRPPPFGPFGHPDMDHPGPPTEGWPSFPQPDRRNGPPFWARARFNAPIYLTLISLAHAFVYFRRSQQRDRRALELESQLSRARLQALRMQLQPHFLFNTLNAISTLVQINPQAAQDMIGSLGQMLRLSLDSGSDLEVPLERELKFLNSYLEIAQIRFGDRLSVRYDIAPDSRPALVPTFILQPLVENAVRHGIEPGAGPGVIGIRVGRTGERLAISINDTGVGLPEAAAPAAPNGIGIANTLARLETLYPGQYRFEVRNAPAGGCVAELEIPFHTAPDRAGRENQTP